MAQRPGAAVARLRRCLRDLAQSGLLCLAIICSSGGVLKPIASTDQVTEGLARNAIGAEGECLAPAEYFSEFAGE
jgi:hypothetical protein